MSERTYGGHTLATVKTWDYIDVCDGNVLRDLIAAAERVEELQTEIGALQKGFSETLDERDQLRAENERLEHTNAEQDKANEWQAKCIATAENYLLMSNLWNDYLRAKWKEEEARRALKGDVNE